MRRVVAVLICGLLIGATRPSTRPATQSGELLRMHRGGYWGENKLLQVFPDGRIDLTTRFGQRVTGSLSATLRPEQLARIADLTTGWDRLERYYAAPVDGFECTITYQRQAVTATPETAPESFQRVEVYLLELVEAIERAHAATRPAK